MDQPNHPVRVVDVEMPFGSMVLFMVKWALASIPAMIILFFVGALLTVAMIAVFGVMGGLASLGGAAATKPLPSPTPITRLK